MGKYQDFSAAHILRETTFGNFENPKTVILYHFSPSEFCILPKNQTSKPSRSLKWQFLTSWNQSKLISPKIRVPWKLLNFHTVRKILNFPHSAKLITLNYQGCVLNGISNVIICGHSDCKAMSVLHSMEEVSSPNESTSSSNELSSNTPIKAWIMK